jgi:hypothetical protein
LRRRQKRHRILRNVLRTCRKISCLNNEEFNVRLQCEVTADRSIAASRYICLTTAVLRILAREFNILHTTKRKKANWIGYIWRRNCLARYVIEGKMEGRMEVTRRR